MKRAILLAAVLGLAAGGTGDARPRPSDPTQCRILDLTLQPATGADNRFAPQIVAWLEDAAGNYVDTIYITQATGTFGLGNRPGRFDFNSAPFWPYGRRITTFPVWANKQPLMWPQLGFQDADDNDLSHSGAKSSRDTHYCRPLHSPDELDAVSCPSSLAYTDKGINTDAMSHYPPRSDIQRAPQDSFDVDMFDLMNPFDAVSQPTPAIGHTSTASFAVPTQLPSGSYVLFVEVSKEFDFNASYDASKYPSPTGIPWSDYGAPYRGQPSVIYKVPFQMTAGVVTTATTLDYIGHGDPDGVSGAIVLDDTIETGTPGSGAGRLAILSDGGTQFRVKLTSYFEDDQVPPAQPADMSLMDVTSSKATIGFVAPGDDGTTGHVTSYEVRYSSKGPLTDATFETGVLLSTPISPADPGEPQQLQLENLLPDTTYYVAVRALDNCHNAAPLATFEVTTLPRKLGEVDACFIATAAYGSVMADDVGILRTFRDQLLKRSVLGELATETYYTLGPALSGLIGESEILRETARGALEPVVTKVRKLRF